MKKFLKILGLVTAIAATALYVWFGRDPDRDLGSGYFYTDGLIFSDHDEIPYHVKSYNYNDRFVVAEQKPMGSIQHAYSLIGLIDKESDYDATYYWIADKREQRLYGPLSLPRFKQLSDSLNTGLHLVHPHRLL